MQAWQKKLVVSLAIHCEMAKFGNRHPASKFLIIAGVRFHG
ncbi:hypothetical protein OH492_07860 [Vibrio chagasii]|nr:hypothetical protein [Vibrio chagasii]